MPEETRRSLAAQRPVIMVLAANAFRGREFAISAPGEEPDLHVFVADVMAGLHLAIRLACFREKSFLVSDVRCDRIGNEEIGTATGRLCQVCQAPLDFRFQPYAKS